MVGATARRRLGAAWARLGLAILAALLVSAAGLPVGAAPGGQEADGEQADDAVLDPSSRPGAGPLFVTEMLAATSTPMADPTPTFVPEPGTTATPTSGRPSMVDDVIRLTNAERASAGLPSLEPNESLMRAAQEYAAVLAPGPCFEHTCPPVPLLKDRIANAGYPSWERIGENIAAGDRTAESVVAGWMSSPGHRANILRAEYKEIGVGMHNGSGRYRVYWVQVFATRWQ